MGKDLDRRRHPRFRTRFDVLCSAGEVEGAGVLKDVSRAGACLAAASHVPALGTKVRLYVFIQPVCPFELAGEVVRVGEDEFAIRYGNLDPEIGRLVDDVAALVTTRD
ncbi:MAG TPA: PilZ domain-containing protein [Myxococcota bacterium]|nr:PilZ domain-containing protein [Myxococcota bacterium]